MIRRQMGLVELNLQEEQNSADERLKESLGHPDAQTRDETSREKTSPYKNAA